MASTSTGFSRLLVLFNPLRAGRDLRDVWKQETPHRWRFLALSAAVTFCIFGVMFQEQYVVEPRSPTVTYIDTFEPGRSDAEIIASNIENQKRKDALLAQRAEREAQIRERYEVVGRVSGIDVEEARQRGIRERAEQAQRVEEARRRAIERAGQNISQPSANDQ
ncbi:hypothetical protein RM533_02960 [Croceicoccus sp. F390]|uniref:Uncharacterized protein n=1 Tax=Croceicoccus esteveae TaxID=3075597 RepID=A0ABU2ZEX0_9SPHN|nr:hypothetical protein [Croceicoccus sp. F390]MDT0575142.1 hypothetical protein [Croceicoccus sp. F390]